jgi:V8-like Glu-specific endopeptidase
MKKYLFTCFFLLPFYTLAQDLSLAIGKVYSAKNTCTATLVSENQIITAAHCLFDKKTKQFINPRHIYFVPDKISSEQNDDLTNIFYAREYTVGLNGIPSGRFTEDKLLGDWALIKLEKPLGCTQNFIDINNFSDSNSIMVLGYPQRPRNAALQTYHCELATPLKNGRMIRLKSCELEHGSSGGPLIVKHNESFKIIGIVAAGANDSKGRYRVSAVPSKQFENKVIHQKLCAN